ncbi:uncharacterized protein LOC122979809 [Thunnus albacares]|uniref:uncharacterized protein LOC122979809 n=1 Tax=Thunnus albacares TaxID=8236 RepID=UPI001CF6C4B4|nr:uncharacterized protein LOC122979809 [Thunnus albacares]
MRSSYLFLLVYLLGSCFASSGTQRNATCVTNETCGQVPDPTSHFLQCVGLSSADTGRDHMRRLKGMLEATMDVYTFMKSSMTGVPLLSLQGALDFNPGADPLQNEALVQMWMEVKIKPLLRSVTKHFLSCLSTKNFSCSTYQTVVRELSHHFSEMNPVRQKWIYTFFMYPFLSGERVAGCVNPNESSEDWLIKNFGAFRAMARMNDFSTLNMVFSGLEVLNLLSPAQKAELLLRPEVAGLDNGTLTLVFHSLLTGDTRPPPTVSPGYSTNYPSRPTYGLYSTPSPHDSLREVVNGFMMAFRPVGSFVHDFVSFTQERNVSEIRSATLTQFLLNWTLAELADVYQPQNTSVIPEEPKFDVTNVEDWYQQVVMPVLRRFFPNVEDLLHENITLAFHEVFYLDHGMANQTTSEIQDVCSITLDKSPCGLTDAVENVAHVLHCAARSNLTMSEETIMRLLEELTVLLNSLMKELSTANFKEVASNFQEIFGEPDSPSLTQSHLEDPNFIKLWFKLKLMPLLPDIPNELLSCLSTKNFSCPVFQTIVEALSKHMDVLYSDPKYSHNIYKHFIFPFLLHHNTSDPQCVSTNNSAEWLQKNFGFFSRFASVTDFYRLNPNFSGLDVLPLLSPKQIAEMLLLPLPTPPEKDVVIDRVFDFLIESHEDLFAKVLYYLVLLAEEVNPPCNVYKQIFERLYGAIPSVPADVEPIIWAGVEHLIYVAPEECLPENITCPVTQFNGTNICREIDSSDLHAHLNASMDFPCNFTLEKYACAQLENFTAHQLASLLKCNLPGSSSHSNVLWKMLLTKLSSVLDPALDILANMSMTMIGPSASEVLDVIGEIRLSMLTDEQLNNKSVIRKWFAGRLREFLPFASGRFLRCLSNRNISCHSYQQILRVFSHQFDNMTIYQQHVVLKNFVLRFLSHSHSGPGCVSGFNSSAEWLRNNLGPFSVLLSVKEILQLNPQFNPLEALRLLSPKQMAELLVLNLPTLPEQEVIINELFDFLTQESEEKKLPDFLFNLVIFLPEGNISCLAYRTLFARLDLAMVTVSQYIVPSIIYSKTALSEHRPPGCIIYSAECNVILTNETDICLGVNSTMLQHYLDSGKMKERLCDFGVEEFACAELSALKAEDLATILKCNRSSSTSGSRPAWKLLLSKASHVLDEALDLLTNMTLDPRNPAVSMILDVIREIRLDVNMANFNDPAFIQLWFNGRLHQFLPAVSSNFLSCLATRDLNCRSYQHIVQILSRVQPRMTLSMQMSVVTHFMRVFLTRNDTADPSCSLHINNSGQWLQRNLGSFSALLSFHQLQMLYSNFSAFEALPQLTVRQLAEVASTPGQLTSAAQVTMVMNHIPNRFLSAFFDEFSPAIMGHESMFPSAVRSAVLQVVFDRANLSDHSVGDSVVLIWLHNRLRPLLVNLSPDHVAPFFRILAGRNCSIEQQGVEDLNETISTLSETTQTEIHNHIIQSLRGPTPLRCYGNNFSHSFYGFLESSFMGFQFPNLTTFLSLMPPNRMHQLVNSIPLSGLGDFLRRPDVVDNDEQLCVIYNNYVQTPVFLETEVLPAAVQRPTLPCVWPMALSSSKQSEINAWFDKRLRNYLVFLTKSLLSPKITNSTSCLAFQKLISVLDKHNYTAADFVRGDVFTITINSYLSSATALPRCYSADNPELNSTAWFAEYIGPFINFLTLEDLEGFGPAEDIQVFTVNPANIALLNHTILPRNLTDYYTELVYQQDSNFNPLLLPLLCRCVASGPAFSQLSAAESIIVLQNLTVLCTDLDPQISAALAGNLGEDIDSSAISALGNESTGISTGQIKMIKPQDLLDSLDVLSTVMGWNEGQAKAIIQALMSSGMLEINSASSLFTLGSLVVGVPSNTFSSIDGSQMVLASKNPSFLSNLVSAPQVVQQTFVTQIISVNSNSEVIINNVPDDFATEIPRALLLGFSNSGDTITILNRKKWKRQQVELFFNVIGAESAESTPTALIDPDDLSSSVLQGFTCTGVRTIRRVQIKRLIRACRRTGTRRVRLVETQLTCMYNYIREESDATSFNLYPHDILLYYDYSLVPQASCRSYFEQLGDADFSVFSLALSYRVTTLFANARSCLGITNTSLTEDNISVLGNMCCTLDDSYIENSDPSILDKLNNCPDLTDAQAAAVQTVLLSGKTRYGAPSTWNEQTLKDLGMLPLYLTSTFYDNFNKRTKRRFLRYFLRVLRRNNVSRQKRRRLKRQIRASIKQKSKRSIVNECTVGTITQVTISDETFPFDYDDITQFNCCLSAATVKDNLAAITDKVDQEEYLKIVLSKLQEAYATTSIVPEDQVQLLGSASREASNNDISTWTITTIDTLSALMDSSDGEWDPSLAKAIISKYLSVAGNKLGSAELNVIGGVNLCSLDADVLKSISQQSLKDADALTVSNCTLEKKKELFTIAVQAFADNTRTTVSASSFQLTAPYMGGAGIAYLRTLSSSNVNMDMATFTSLDESVVQSLSVDEVKGLLGTNLPELKSYENQTLVQNWISSRLQSELDTLGLGLTGGRADSTSTTQAPATTARPSSLTTAGSGSGTSAAGSATTTSHSGARIQAEQAGLSFLILLALLVTSQHIIV